MEDVTQPGVPHSHIVSHAVMAIMSTCSCPHCLGIRTQSTVVASIPTSTLVLTLVYVLVVARHEHNFRIRDCLWMMWNVDVPELALICIISVPSAVSA